MKALNVVTIDFVDRAVVYVIWVWIVLCSHCLSSDSYCWIVDVIVAVLDTVNIDSRMRNDLKAFVVA